MIVRDNGLYLVILGDFCPDSFRILSSIKYTFKSLFGAFWLFAIANIFPLSLHPLIMVVVVKPSGEQTFYFERQHSVAK